MTTRLDPGAFTSPVRVGGQAVETAPTSPWRAVRVTPVRMDPPTPCGAYVAFWRAGRCARPADPSHERIAA